MRILAIRGANLASLTAFDIPLATGPLAGVGLFAITGDTGGGKSTILDAMCLALYGKYPRTSAGGRETLTDVSGEELPASHPSHILRRGAASCFAETDFVGLDGQTYRARWAVRRASKKATGRLQKAEHTLSRLDGSQNIAATTTATIAAVEERSGFTFDQFCRTVLLAQGEFDRFLLADESQRAELLEKITGTEIYTKISASVFEQAGQRKRTLEDLELLRGGTVLLDAPAREALMAERDQKAAQLDAASAACKLIEANLEHAACIAKARNGLDDANVAVRAALDASEAAKPRREHLTLLRAAEPLRVVSVAFEQCGRAAAATGAKRAEASALLQRALNARAQAAARLQSAKEAADATEASVKSFEPEWAKAGALDVQMATARTELAVAATAHEAATITDAQARQTGKQHAENLAALNEAKTQAETALAARASHAPLAANFARIETATGERAALLKRQTEHNQTAARLTAEIAAIDARVKAALAASEHDSARRVQLTGQLEHKRSALAAFDLPLLELRQDALANLATGLDRFLATIERRDEALAQSAAAAADACQAERDGQAATARADAARQAHDASLTSRHDLQPLADLADATLTEHANHLRSVLVDGEPCPVCGASNHPFTATNSAASQLANGVREQRKALDAAIAAASRDLLQAQTAQAGAKARHEAALSAAQDTRGKATAATQHLHASTPAIVTTATNLGLTKLAQGLAGDPVAALVIAQRLLLTSELETVSKRRTAGNTLLKEADALQVEIDTASRHAETERKAADTDRATLAGLTATATGNAASLGEIREQLTASLSELEPYLVIAGIAPADLDAKTAATRQRLHQLAETYDGLKQELARLGTADVEVRTTRQTADERAHAASRALDLARQTLAERGAALDTLTAQRAQVLSGEETTDHKNRIAGQNAEARRALETARAASAETDTAFAAADATHKASEAEHESAKAEFAQTALAWTSAVAARALTPERALELLAVPPETASGLSAELERLDQSQTKALAVAALRHSELDGYLTAGAELDAAALEALRGEREDHLAQSNALTDERNQIDFTLKTDDEARGRMSTLASEIGAAKADHEVWSAVDDAVGASNGAKFRRFAQGVTLGHLVHLANRQLAALNPRYALRVNPSTDLSLDVVDQDMGDEIRGPRSLSGGERFLVSLALALALSGLEGRQSFVDSLFIDEGFGGLDRDTLDMAIDALESLQSHGRKVGVITHVAAMIERIPIQVRVEKRGGGRSVVRLQDNGPPDIATIVDLPTAAE